jgi:hypothetical protein
MPWRQIKTELLSQMWKIKFDEKFLPSRMADFIRSLLVIVALLSLQQPKIDDDDSRQKCVTEISLNLSSNRARITFLVSIVDF